MRAATTERAGNQGRRVVTPQCSICSIKPGDRAGVVLWTHEVRGRRRTVSWTICNACDLVELEALKDTKRAT